MVIVVCHCLVTEVATTTMCGWVWVVIVWFQRCVFAAVAIKKKKTTMSEWLWFVIVWFQRCVFAAAAIKKEEDNNE